MPGGILNDTETLSPVLPDALEEATRRLLAKACERQLVLATATSSDTAPAAAISAAGTPSSSVFASSL